jgi:hypothetical protein
MRNGVHKQYASEKYDCQEKIENRSPLWFLRLSAASYTSSRSCVDVYPKVSINDSMLDGFTNMFRAVIPPWQDRVA